ncbi:MAG: hypothetical protein J5874_03690 [Oscillospiraceae bacterium]|nr:hypothetical protein [Oscillospiraceae bacterium]
MSNSIALAQKYLPMLDEIYQFASLTSPLDYNVVDYSGGNVVKIFKTSLQGLANYDRNSGFIDGSVTGSWETLTLNRDRARSFIIDRMDNDETLDQAFGSLAGEFIRTKVAPEIDAYRFATYASTSGISAATPATLTAATIIDAIDTAVLSMDENEVPCEGRILFITPANYSLLKKATAGMRFAPVSESDINTNIETYDGMRIIKVPQGRFKTAITLYDGSTSGQTDGGYVAASGAKDINFMIIHPSAVLQVPKHTLPRVFSPDENQKADAWKFDYRIYHDAFVLSNKLKGVYLHSKA